MPPQPVPGASAGPGRPGRPGRERVASAYSPAEWRLLTRLPGQVIVAAMLTGAGPATRTRTVRSGVAGLAAIAAGRASDSDLVRAVARDIYAGAEEWPAGGRTVDRAAAVVGLFPTCRAVARLLAESDPADSAAYRQWVQSVAARVCAARHRDPRTGEAARRAGEAPLCAVDRRFLDDLGVALGLP